MPYKDLIGFISWCDRSDQAKENLKNVLSIKKLLSVMVTLFHILNAKRCHHKLRLRYLLRTQICRKIHDIHDSKIDYLLRLIYSTDV